MRVAELSESKMRRKDAKRLPAEYQAQIDRALADTAPDVEPDTGNAPDGAKNASGFHSPCRIRIHSVRKRLADSDGVSGKAAIDGLVHAAILRDDSPECVESVAFSQEKGVIEYTEITIEEIGGVE